MLFHNARVRRDSELHRVVIASFHIKGESELERVDDYRNLTMTFGCVYPWKAYFLIKVSPTNQMHVLFWETIFLGVGKCPGEAFPIKGPTAMAMTIPVLLEPTSRDTAFSTSYYVLSYLSVTYDRRFKAHQASPILMFGTTSIQQLPPAHVIYPADYKLIPCASYCFC